MRQMVFHIESFGTRTVCMLVLMIGFIPGTMVLAQNESAKLTASDGASFDNFGRAVALSAEHALIGAYLDDDKGSNAGAAYIFEMNNGNWVEAAKLTANDGAAGNVFGSSVSISENRAVIGARNDDDNGTSSGSAYIFALENGTWTQEAKLIASDGGPIEEFGSSVSISGTYAIVGAHQHDAFFTNSGAAYVYELQNGNWTEVAKLTPGDAPAGGGGFFGIAVSISGDRALVGAHLDSEVGTFAGAAYVFERQNGVWTEVVKLTASDGAAEDRFGFQLSLDGNRAIIGSYHDDDNGTDSGAAYIFELENGSWNEVAKLTASDGAVDDEFGFSVSLSGNRALVGAHLDDDKGTDSGSAYIFELQNGSWNETNKLTASDGAAGDAFGWLYASSISGDHALVGAYLDDDNGTDSGSAYLFDLTAEGLTVSSFTLIDAGTDLPVSGFDPMPDGAILNLRELPRGLNIRANTEGGVESVRFDFNGDAGYRTENVAPYALFGDSDGDYNRGKFLTGYNTLTATPYSLDGAQGDAGAAASISFSVLRKSPNEAFSQRVLIDAATNSNPVVLPEAYTLDGAFPNPFNPSTTIRFALPEQAPVHLVVFDMLGREVQGLVDGILEAGWHEVAFDASGLPSGTYLYRLETPALTVSKSMLLLK